MQRSPRWDAAIASSGRMVTLASILYGGVPVLRDLSIVAGSVVQDTTAASRGRCDVQLAEPTLIPADLGDPLSPDGYEIVLERGVVYRSARAASSRATLTALVTEDGDVLVTEDGDVIGWPLIRYSPAIDAVIETKPLGVFPIQDSLIDGVTLLTSISALDRSQRVRDAMLEDDYPIAGGTPFTDAIRTLIDFCVPGLEFDFVDCPHVTPPLVLPAFSDPFDHAQLMARSVGMELFFNGYGRPVLRPELDVRTAAPVTTIAEGDGQTLKAISMRRDRTKSYNRWIAIGNNSANTTQYRGVATDDDPSSPSYYYGRFGRKPAPPFKSTLIGSQAQAEAAAYAKLIGGLGIARELSAEATTNPALEAGDPILFKRERIGVNEVHIADSITTGLGAEEGQTFQCRARQLAA